MAAKTYEHLAVCVKLQDPAFDDYWTWQQSLLTDLKDGGTITLNAKQLHLLKKLAFAAGRQAALAELTLSGAN